MLRWARARVRRWRRGRARDLTGKRDAPSSGSVTVAACHPAGPAITPPLLTVLRAGFHYQGMFDTEIRGFLDGTVKLERNVATQYHVRIGCEGSKPDRGRYEVMRVLQRWDLSSLPHFARVLSARLVLSQEDLAGFPARHPQRWPADFLLHDVRKPWGPGRGGVGRDNVSRPEPGDAWWLEARAGELAWQVPGCGFGTDGDPRADRGNSPLAAARLPSASAELVFSGPSLARHVEATIAGRRSLDLLIAASPADEALPGSIKAFFSREYGDDRSPWLRPRLEIEWSAPALWIEERAFVLEPGGSTSWRPAHSLESTEGVTLAASVRLDDASAAGGAILPVAFAGETPLEVPARGPLGADVHLRLTTAVAPVPAGERAAFSLLETWSPAVPRPDDLVFRFRFFAPSGRSFEAGARHAGDRRYVCEIEPDEMGVWTYSWSTTPDTRFLPHVGGGRFTVTRAASADAHAAALRRFAERALAGAGHPLDLVARRRLHFRLTALQREATEVMRTAASLSPGATRDLEEVLERAARAVGGMP